MRQRGRAGVRSLRHGAQLGQSGAVARYPVMTVLWTKQKTMSGHRLKEKKNIDCIYDFAVGYCDGCVNKAKEKQKKLLIYKSNPVMQIFVFIVNSCQKYTKDLNTWTN